jgi:hypothetical protein
VRPRQPLFLQKKRLSSFKKKQPDALRVGLFLYFPLKCLALFKESCYSRNRWYLCGIALDRVTKRQISWSFNVVQQINRKEVLRWCSGKLKNRFSGERESR